MKLLILAKAFLRTLNEAFHRLFLTFLLRPAPPRFFNRLWRDLSLVTSLEFRSPTSLDTLYRAFFFHDMSIEASVI